MKLIPITELPVFKKVAEVLGEKRAEIELNNARNKTDELYGTPSEYFGLSVNPAASLIDWVTHCQTPLKRRYQNNAGGYYVL